MDKIPDAVIEAMCEAGGGSPYWQDYIVHNALKAAEAAGWVLVPVEANEQMVLAAGPVLVEAWKGQEWASEEHHLVADMGSIWRLMIAAAPKAIP